MAKHHRILSARPRQLRRQMTVPERLLWSKLRNNGLFGLKFRRQHPVGPFILDYFCAERQLCGELDGNSHDGRIAKPTMRGQVICGSRASRMIRAHD